MATTHVLNLVQGEVFSRGFRRRIDTVPFTLTGWSFAGQIRKREKLDAELLLDLTPLLSIDADDASILNLDINADVTRGLPRFPDTAAWDIFIWPNGDTSRAILFLQGAATLDPATTVVTVAP